jgi:hypothetical protein
MQRQSLVSGLGAGLVATIATAAAAVAALL